MDLFFPLECLLKIIFPGEGFFKFIIYCQRLRRIRFFSFWRGAGGSGNNDHGFPFCGDVELVEPSLTYPHFFFFLFLFGKIENSLILNTCTLPMGFPYHGVIEGFLSWGDRLLSLSLCHIPYIFGVSVVYRIWP